MTERGMRRKLKFSRVRDALTFPFKNILTLLGVALCPALIMLALMFASVQIIPAGAYQTLPPDDANLWLARYSIAIAAFTVLPSLFLTIYAVAIHRLIVCGERPGFVILRFRRYELAYLGVLILVYMLELALDFIIPLIAQNSGNLTVGEIRNPAVPLSDEVVTLLVVAAWVLATLVVIWVLLRLALIFPHVAITGRIGFIASWRATKGNVWRMFLGLVTLGVLVAIIWMMISPVLLITGIALQAFHTPGNSAQNFYQTALTFFATIVPILAILGASGIAYISYAYKDLVEEAATVPVSGHVPAVALSR